MINYTYEYNELGRKQFSMFCFMLSQTYAQNHLATIATQQAIQRSILDIQSRHNIHTKDDSTFSLALTYNKIQKKYTLDRSTWALYLKAAEKSAQKQKPALRTMYVAAVFVCLSTITLATLSPGSNEIIAAFSATPSFEPTVIVLFAVLGAALLTVLCAGAVFEAVKWNKDNRRLFAEFKQAYNQAKQLNATMA